MMAMIMIMTMMIMTMAMMRHYTELAWSINLVIFAARLIPRFDISDVLHIEMCLSGNGIVHADDNSVTLHKRLGTYCSHCHLTKDDC